MAFLLAKPTPHNVNHDNDRFSMFNKKRDIIVNPRVEQPTDNLREAANGRMSHRRPAGFIRDIRICVAR